MISKFYGREFSTFEVLISTVLSDFQIKIIDEDDFQVESSSKGSKFIFKKSKIFKNMKFPICFNHENVDEEEYKKMISLVYGAETVLQQEKQEQEHSYQQGQRNQNQQEQPLSLPTNLPSTPFTDIGRADIDPTGSMAGNSGGMIVGPEHPIFNGRSADRVPAILPARPGFGDPSFMPGNPYDPLNPNFSGRMGNPNDPTHPGVMPDFPSHPPGARFDPVFPFGSNPSFPNRPLGRGQGRGGRGGFR